MYNYKYFKILIVFFRMKNNYIKDVNILIQKVDQLGIVFFVMFDLLQLEYGMGLGGFFVGDFYVVYGLICDLVVNGVDFGQIIF